MYYKKPTDVLGVLNGRKVKKPTPLRFTNNSDSESSVSFTGLSADIRYKLNGNGDYTQWNGSAIALQPGQFVEMVGDNGTRISISSQHFEIDGQLAASGSIMSLVSSAKIIKTIPQVDDFFGYLFYGCTGLTAAPELPATALAEGCYTSMFYGCTGLTAAPELPATALAGYCYTSMFFECTGLTAAPELPATALAEGCYSFMFSDCTGLTAAPELPATALAEGCYNSMFYGCTGLTAAPELPATALADECYSSMFYGCTGLTSIEVSFDEWVEVATDYWVVDVDFSGTFTCPAGLEQIFDESHIPTGWTVVTK